MNNMTKNVRHGFRFDLSTNFQYYTYIYCRIVGGEYKVVNKN